MNKLLDEARSRELAQQVKSRAKTPFDNAYRAALAINGSVYVQGFLVIAGKRRVIEHAWIEQDEAIVDPSLPFLNQSAEGLHYFPAQRLSVKQLKAAIEEAKEDYPEDEPLPIYGAAPYEYYGDLMLGGQDYLDAHAAAQQECRQISKKLGSDN